MQEKASVIQREAKALLAGLKDLTKKNGQLDKDVDFQRKNLRSQYLRLLLSYPYAKESRDVETHLWMQTSYQFISFYKQKIGALDRKLYARPVGLDQGQGGRQEGRGENNFVEYRKLLQRFRQFLAEEEKFFSLLLVRLQKVFDLHEVHPALVKLDLLAVDHDDLVSKGKGRNILPEQQEVERPSQEQRENVIIIFGKFLVCLGDIARYREHYNDSDGRPRAGTEHTMPRKASSRGGKKGTNPAPRPRNYYRSQLIYEQARLLVPEDGNASHQLAVLAAYEKDNFATVYHYYRALCVRCPYDPASENLTSVLRKAAEQYRTANREEINDGARRDPKIRLARFKSWVVLLHGLWYLDNDETAFKATKLAKNVGLEFAALITDRVLQPDTVSQVVILSLGALWKLRIVRDTVKPLESPRNKFVEPLMVMHILDLAQSLFTTGCALLLDDMQDKEDLGQRIPAVLRRTLPSIRIFMKWLRSNLSYMLSVNFSSPSSDLLQNVVGDFWRAWAQFFSALMEGFPIARLPTSEGPLEEDVEVSGFSPIKRHLLVQPEKTDNGLAPDQAQVHPNEEFLMRISDLSLDAQAVSASEGCPIVLASDKYVVKDITGAERPAITSPVGGLEDIMERHPNPPRMERRDDDESTTQTSRTEDDPVGEAVRAALAAGAIDDDDDDDQIVWALRQPESPRIPLASARVVSDPFTPVQAPLDSRSGLSGSESQQQQTTTAQDLLNGVLGNKKFGRSAAMKPPSSFGADSAAFLSGHARIHDNISAPAQSSLLFGSGSPRAPTTSIWSNLDGELVSGSGIANYSSAIPHAHYLNSPDRFHFPSHFAQPGPTGMFMEHSEPTVQQGEIIGSGKGTIPPTNVSFTGQEKVSFDHLSAKLSGRNGMPVGNHGPTLGPFTNYPQASFAPDPFMGFPDTRQAAWNKR